MKGNGKGVNLGEKGDMGATGRSRGRGDYGWEEVMYERRIIFKKSFMTHTMRLYRRNS